MISLEDDDSEMNEWLCLNAEWPGFQPHIIVGWTESEWHRFCSFYDTLSEVTEKSVIKIMEAADAVLENAIDSHILQAFEAFVGINHISVADGLTHPDAWIRNLTKISVIRRQTRDLSL